MRQGPPELFNISTGDFLDKSTSRLDSAQRSKTSKAVAIQMAARKSLTKLLTSMSAFAFDCGLSTSQVNLMLRTAAVQSAATRQLEYSSRVNISGIAAVTGIPRGEVSRILNSSGTLAVGSIQGRQSITNEILSAWHCDPDYLIAGRPRDLMIFGRGSTFESLVRKYGRGIPIRAVLDELKRAGAIQLLTSSQRMLPKMQLAISPRITHRKIRDLNARMDDLFEGLLSQSGTVLVDRVSGAKSWSGNEPLVRKRLGPNAIALVRDLQTKLALSRVNHRAEGAQSVAHLNIKIVYRRAQAQLKNHSMKGRRNFHRTRQPQYKPT